MIRKKKLYKTLDSKAEEFKDQLILMDKIKRGEKQSGSGEVISEKELEKEMNKWFD